jgi:hypothetical protein
MGILIPLSTTLAEILSSLTILTLKIISESARGQMPGPAALVNVSLTAEFLPSAEGLSYQEHYTSLPNFGGKYRLTALNRPTSRGNDAYFTCSRR